ncbi:MAG: cbiQ [Burkholderiaceae bacterium]|nr:cbiQ [Burkholderiaceae bacterium]
MNDAKPNANFPACRQSFAARTWLLLYLAGIVTITFIHQPAILAIMLAGALLVSGKERWRHLRRTMLAILVFNLTISAGYIAVCLWQGAFSLNYLLLVNLRAILMAYLGFWFVGKVSILDAVAGWHTVSLLATLAIGQIKTFERILADFRAAFESRNLARPGWLARSRHAAAQAQTLLDKSFAASNEAAQAMRSRGVFDD